MNILQKIYDSRFIKEKKRTKQHFFGINIKTKDNNLIK